MNFNMELIGFKDEIFTKMEKIIDATVIYIELPKKKYICPSCSKAIRLLKNGWVEILNSFSLGYSISS